MNRRRSGWAQLWWPILNFAAAWGSSLKAIHHIFERSTRRRRGTDVGGGLLTTLTAVRDGGLSEQEMTWPPLWETGPPRQQPPQLWASRVTTSTHRGQWSNSRSATGEKICWSWQQRLRVFVTKHNSALDKRDCECWVSKSRCELHHCYS